MPTLKIAKDSPLAKRLVSMLSSRIKFAERSHTNREEKWRKAEEVVLAYLPEQEADAQRRVARENEGKPKYTTLQLPYTYALLMSAHTYISSVFFARAPIHQFSGRHGEGEQATQAVEALVSYQVEVGEMIAPYYLWIYDALKYGVGIVGEYWCKDTLHVGQIIENEDAVSGKVQKLQVVQEVVAYEGCKSYNVSPYDFMHDPRVPIGRFQDGEFCICKRKLSWTQIVRRVTQGYYMSLDDLKEYRGAPPPQQGSGQLERPEDRDYISEGESDQHPASMWFYEVYVDLIPSEWGVGDTNFPMKWVFTLTYDQSLVVGAQPLGLVHGRFPFSILETEVEGYGLFSRGVPDIMDPLQNTMDWLLNTHFYNVRAALNNQFILDPSKLVVEDAEDGGPGFRYRLRPEAFGTDISKIFMQVPVTDVTKGHMQDLQQMIGMGERVFGVSDQIMGAVTGTTRRTATEVRTATGFGVNRMKTISEFMSAVGISSHAQRLVQTSQQFYTGEKKFRIVGDLAQSAGPAFMDITPDSIAGFFNFVPVDGTLPVDRMAQANLWKELLANIRNYPQIAMSYDLTRIFAWVAQIAGLKNINQFRIQVMPPGVAPQGQPLQLPAPGAPPTGVQAGQSASTAAGLDALYGEGGQ